ncbi:WD40-repeat-containing domain protein [Pelagophyceae sp. CCMP2097]|nr:WD40-repeat-containing domain protein [Pelagophyceae sp. CCMP2097]
MAADAPRGAPISDLETLLNGSSADMSSSVLPRWQRKANAASSDRFIPARSGMDMDRAHHALTARNEPDDEKRGSASRSQALKSGLLNDGRVDDESASRVLAYRNKAPAPRAGYVNDLQVLYTANKGPLEGAAQRRVKATRHIPSAPSRVLDAPELLDDYYLNLCSWGANNCVAVALGATVYVWDAATGGITELVSLEDDDYVCSVAWLPGETHAGHLAVGTSSGATELWDVGASRCLRKMDGHSARVSALAWNSHTLTSAGRDATIVHHDVRIRGHVTGTGVGHTQEICGLTWSPDGKMLASGGNDNVVNIWSAERSGERDATAAHSFTDHTAAVKALAWCPFERHTLASGGGTADRCIKLWNASTGANLQSVDTGSQVCALQWSQHEKELLSGHGYAENQLSLWKYPSMARVKDLKGHTGRVLALCTSPDGTTCLSAGADETLRFWECFGTPKTSAGGAKKACKTTTLSSQRIQHIR